MTPAKELATLRAAYDAGEVSAEVATKRAGQLLARLGRTHGTARTGAILLWNEARAAVRIRQRGKRYTDPNTRARSMVRRVMA